MSDRGDRDGKTGVAAVSLETMAAEWQIRNVIARFARAVDRRDAERVRDCYHADAVNRYGVFEGDLDQYVPWVLAEVGKYSRTMHFAGASIIDWPDGPELSVAAVETYSIVLHEKDGGEQGENWVGGIRYLDRFERRGDSAQSWKISERTVVGDWLRIDPLAHHRRFSRSMPTGQPGQDDALYHLLAQTLG